MPASLELFPLSDAINVERATRFVVHLHEVYSNDNKLL